MRVRAGLWGSAGPVLITILGAMFFGPFEREPYGVVMAAANNVSNSIFLVLLEGALGFFYGFTRRKRARSIWWKGALSGLLVWACLALPVACAMLVLVFFASTSPHSGQNSFRSGLGAVVGFFLAQLVCGAVAGLLVELYQQRTVPPGPGR